ncbi:hypothetical protein BSNK01_31070 [Bacillaceae bacterium]
MAKRKKRRIRISVLVLLLIIISALFHAFSTKNIWLQVIADYLTIPDQPQKSDVIIVLGGEVKGERTERAVQLYQAGFAPRLLFSDGTDLSWRLKAVEEMTALARKLGVPKTAIFTEERSRSTYENAIYTRKILAEKGWKSALVVTSVWHTRRAKMIFDKVYAGSGITLSYAGAMDKRFPDFRQWWKDGEKQQVVLTEWAKIAVYQLKYGVFGFFSD